MWVFILTIVIIIFDQLSKYAVSANMKLYDSFNVIPNILNFTYIQNQGAAFGILENHRWVFIVMSTIAIGAMIFFLFKLSINKGYIQYKILLSFIIGGGIGNMIDRLRLGYVVDFLEFDFVNFAVFNIADSFVCIGSILLCIFIIFGHENVMNVFSNKKKSETISEEKSENE